MKLYHSTNVSFDVIDLAKSKPNKDFGRAFYVSANASEIEPVGRAKVILHGGDLNMLVYEFDETRLYFQSPGYVYSYLEDELEAPAAQSTPAGH